MPFFDENRMRRQPVFEPQRHNAPLIGWTDEEIWAAALEGLNSGRSVEVDFDELLKQFKADRAARLQRNGEA
jgi:hypothetical protein